MSETAQHPIQAEDSSLEAITALTALDLSGLSYVQLKRLEKRLREVSAAVQSEIEKRAEVDNAGDTVTVPLQES